MTRHTILVDVPTGSRFDGVAITAVAIGTQPQRSRSAGRSPRVVRLTPTSGLVSFENFLRTWSAVSKQGWRIGRHDRTSSQRRPVRVVAVPMQLGRDRVPAAAERPVVAKPVQEPGTDTGPQVQRQDSGTGRSGRCDPAQQLIECLGRVGQPRQHGRDHDVARQPGGGDGADQVETRPRRLGARLEHLVQDRITDCERHALPTCTCRAAAASSGRSLRTKVPLDKTENVEPDAANASMIPGIKR